MLNDQPLVQFFSRLQSPVTLLIVQNFKLQLLRISFTQALIFQKPISSIHIIMGQTAFHSALHQIDVQPPVIFQTHQTHLQKSRLDHQPFQVIFYCSHMLTTRLIDQNDLRPGRIDLYLGSPILKRHDLRALQLRMHYFYLTDPPILTGDLSGK